MGMDYGLKTFLTISDGTMVDCPLWLKSNLKNLQKLQHRHDKAECRWDKTNLDGSHPKGARIVWESNHRKALAKDIVRIHCRISSVSATYGMTEGGNSVTIFAGSTMSYASKTLTLMR